VLATQNPIEMEGTYPLPEAQLDRFLFKVLVPFPSDAELARIGELTTGLPRPAPGAALAPDGLRAAMGLARRIVVAPHVLEHAVRLVAATHPDRSPVDEVRRFVRYGASPRGLQALLLGAKVLALRAGRWNVAFDDLERIAPPALRHRMILQFEATAEGVGADRLVGRILETVRGAR
jgi:MoxR-like ATPase